MESPRRLPVDVTLPSCGVFVLESHHAPDFRMAAQCHTFLELFYVLEGRGAFHIGAASHPCQQDDVVVIPIGRPHWIEDDPEAPLALYGICIAPEVWRHEPGLLEAVPAGRLAVDVSHATRIRAFLRRLLFEQTLTRAGSCLQILGLTLQMLAVLARGVSRSGRCPPGGEANSRHRHAVQRYVADLPTQFFEATDLDQTAAELGMSRRRFTHLFRQTTGCTWAVYLNRLRIEYACQLLRETDRSIIAIAFESGFEDLSSFYRAFKRHTGLPPRAWQDHQGSQGTTR